MNPACDSFLPLISAFVDGESSASDRRALEMHLSACRDCSARVADLRALRETLHAALISPAEAVDFSDFGRKVMSRITPAREPLRNRLAVLWSEIWTYNRGAIIMSLATAVMALAVGGPVIWMLARQSARGDVIVHSLQADNPSLTPVVLQTEDGATMVMFVDHPDEANPEGTGSTPGQAPLKTPNPDEPREEKL